MAELALNLGNGAVADARAAEERTASATGAAAAGSFEAVSAAPIVPTTPEMSLLSAFINRVFRENALHRETSGTDARLLAAMRASKGEYSEAEKAKFAAAKLPANIYTPLTVTKQRAALSQISEMVWSPGDKCWTLAPSPMPEVPESVAREEFQRIVASFMQIVAATGEVPTPEQMFRYAQSRMDEVHRKQIEWAKVRARRMERKVHDLMIEGGWIDVFQEFSKFLVDYGTAAIVGPVPRVEMRRRVRETKLGTWKYTLEPTEVLSYEAVNPWDLYPSKGARRVEDGYLCVRRRFTTDALWRYASKKAKDAADDGGWFAGTVEALLSRWPEGGAKIDGQPYDLIRSIMEHDGPSDENRCMMEGVEFFGDVRGSLLLQIGILHGTDGAEIDPAEFYEVDAIDIAGYVVYCKVIDRRIGRPVSKGVFYADAGSWWGGSIAERVDAAQRVMNAALRNLVNNMAMASGPMLFIKDADRLEDKSPGALQIKPWNVLKFRQGGYGQTDIPVGTIAFDSQINELLAVFNWAKTQADDDSGIPAYTYGNAAGGGALRTASGLTMLLSEANRVMKAVMTRLDAEVVRNVVRRTVDWNMVYGRDLSIKGDCEVNPSGVIGMILREQESQRRKQLMAVVGTPLAMQVLGPKPFVELVRADFRDGQYGVDNIDDLMPSKERLEEEEMLQQLERLNRATQGGAAQGQPQPGGEGEASAGGEPAAQGDMDAGAAMGANAAQAPQGEVQSPEWHPVSANQMRQQGGVRERRSAA